MWGGGRQGGYQCVPHTMATSSSSSSSSSVEPPQRWCPILFWEHSSSSVSVPVQWTSPTILILLSNIFAGTTDPPNTQRRHSPIFHGSSLSVVPCSEKPSWRHTTMALAGPQDLNSLHTLPHILFTHASSLPLELVTPPSRRISPSLHSTTVSIIIESQ